MLRLRRRAWESPAIASRFFRATYSCALYPLAIGETGIRAKIIPEVWRFRDLRTRPLFSPFLARTLEANTERYVYPVLPFYPEIEIVISATSILDSRIRVRAKERASVIEI